MITEALLAEIAAGKGETLTVAARRFPPTRAGRPVTLSCLLRWVLEGVKTVSGVRVHLEAARNAGRWVTSPAAIQRFIAAQNPESSEQMSVGRSPGKRQRASERAERELEKAGI